MASHRQILASVARTEGSACAPIRRGLGCEARLARSRRSGAMCGPMGGDSPRASLVRQLGDLPGHLERSFRVDPQAPRRDVPVTEHHASPLHRENLRIPEPLRCSADTVLPNRLD